MLRYGTKGQIKTVEAVIAAFLLLIFVQGFYTLPELPERSWDEKKIIYSSLKSMDKNGSLRTAAVKGNVDRIEANLRQKVPDRFNLSVSLVTVDEYENNKDITFSVPPEFKVIYGKLEYKKLSKASNASLNGVEIELEDKPIKIKSDHFQDSNQFNVTDLNYELKVYRSDTSRGLPINKDIKGVSYFLSGKNSTFKLSEVRINFW